MAAGTETSSLVEFQHQVADLVGRLKEKGEPLELTLNGKVRFVVRDLKGYYQLIQVLEQAEAVLGIRRGLEEMKRGEGRPAEQVFAEIRKEYGIRD